MGKHKDYYGYSSWSGSDWATESETTRWRKDKKEALEEYNDPTSPGYHKEDVITHYNGDYPDNPITDKDKEYYAEHGTWDESGVGTPKQAATEASEYETWLSQKREAERDEAKKKQESFLANQPYYPVSETTKAYAQTLFDISRLLNITDASGGGSPTYYVTPTTIKESPAYSVDQGKKTESGAGSLAEGVGGSPVGTKHKIPVTYDRLSDFASASGNSTYLKQTF